MAETRPSKTLDKSVALANPDIGTCIHQGLTSQIPERDHSPEGRIILLKFPSRVDAQGWHDDPDYQALSEHRWAGTDLGFLIIVHGLPPRG
ncbi:MAG: DUF1330 domain-containing protein [Pseudomonadota bacterium]